MDCSLMSDIINFIELYKCQARGYSRLSGDSCLDILEHLETNNQCLTNQKKLGSNDSLLSITVYEGKYPDKLCFITRYTCPTQYKVEHHSISANE